MKNAPGSDSRGGDSDESRDDPHANLYVPEGHLPDPTVRDPISEDDTWGEDERFEELENAIEEVVETKPNATTLLQRSSTTTSSMLSLAGTTFTQNRRSLSARWRIFGSTVWLHPPKATRWSAWGTTRRLPRRF